MVDLMDSKNEIEYMIKDKDGKKLASKRTLVLAESYLETLPEDVKEGATIVTVTDTGKQVLFG